MFYEKGATFMYKVIRKDSKQMVEEKYFDKHREALCFATDYKKMKSSQIFKKGQLLAEFKGK
ncbi:hypothetical protein RV10_GL003835 [Enterococcus pallens]|nr:hypothetical protein RV10_GL003835 [Enterococcus pallens]